MPTIQAQGKTFECEPGANLRQVLLAQGVDLYNGAASLINCHAIGTCGTCAVQIEGDVSAMGWREQTRLGLPPHHQATTPSRPHTHSGNRRLACQVRVLGDLTVSKYDGFWGQGSHAVWTATASHLPLAQADTAD